MHKPPGTFTSVASHGEDTSLSHTRECTIAYLKEHLDSQCETFLYIVDTASDPLYKETYYFMLVQFWHYAVIRVNSA